MLGSPFNFSRLGLVNLLHFAAQDAKPSASHGLVDALSVRHEIHKKPVTCAHVSYGAVQIVEYRSRARMSATAQYKSSGTERCKSLATAWHKECLPLNFSTAPNAFMLRNGTGSS
jgi:hypothetical protein